MNFLGGRLPDKLIGAQTQEFQLVGSQGVECHYGKGGTNPRMQKGRRTAG